MHHLFQVTELHWWPVNDLAHGHCVCLNIGACFVIGYLRSLVVRALERYSRVRVPVEIHVFHISSIIHCMDVLFVPGH